MQVAVVTGAGGFIGGALTQKLLSDGMKVYGVDISADSLLRFNSYDNFVPVCINLEKESISSYLDEKCDVFYYLAWGGQLGGKDLSDENLQVKNIMTAVRTCRSMVNSCNKYIFCSSSYEYMRSCENDEIYVNIYGIAKRSAAEMCAAIALQNGMNFNKAILTNTYGVGDRSKKAVNTIINAMNNNISLTLVEGNNKNDWAYIDDTVDGLINIFKKGKNHKTYYIGHREISTFKEKILAMRSLLCPERELIFGGYVENTYVDYSCIDLDALYDDTGFECKTEFNESIIKTSEWLKNKKDKV